MPDRRKHRGKHPDDDRLFANAQHDALRLAVEEHAWLLTRGYAEASALKLVGDRHNLTARQRMAVRRSTCSNQSLHRRSATMITLNRVGNEPLGIDGYNLLITIESAMSGGLILIGRDGCCRDLASIHGTYRRVGETVPAVEMIAGYLAEFHIPRVDWYLDRPVSNSGRLKALMGDVLAARGSDVECRRSNGGGPGRPSTFDLRPPTSYEMGHPTTWNIELADRPDAVLADYTGVVATSDSVILDRCRAWVNLAAGIIDARVPSAWKVDLRTGDNTS